jgi:NADH-quinone oxidoreductase subunit E
VRTALRRFRRLVGFLLIALAGWAVLRRRSAPVRWIEAGTPPESPARTASPEEPEELGGPGELPADVLATDAGLTELPPVPAASTPAGSPAGSPAGDSPDGFAGAPAWAPDGGSVDQEAVDAPTGTVVVDEDLAAEEPELGIDEPTMTIARADLADDDETSTRIPMPTFSEAPTMEIPAVTDDLRAVRGIGPSMERLLHGLGIISYRQLAMLDGVELERVRAELSDFRTRIERENWVGQARDLHKGKYGRDPA